LARNSGRFAADREVRLLMSVKGCRLGQVHRHEERLLERVTNPVGLVEQCVQRVFDLPWCGKWAIDTFSNIDGALTNSPLIRRVGQQVFRQGAVQVHQGVAVELGAVDVFDQNFDRRLMVQNYLCFDGGLATCDLAVLDEFTCIET